MLNYRLTKKWRVQIEFRDSGAGFNESSECVLHLSSHGISVRSFICMQRLEANDTSFRT